MYHFCNKNHQIIFPFQIIIVESIHFGFIAQVNANRLMLILWLQGINTNNACQAELQCVCVPVCRDTRTRTCSRTCV